MADYSFRDLQLELSTSLTPVSEELTEAMRQRLNAVRREIDADMARMQGMTNVSGYERYGAGWGDWRGMSRTFSDAAQAFRGEPVYTMIDGEFVELSGLLEAPK